MSKTHSGSSLGGRLRLLAGMAISLGALAILISGIEWDRFWSVLQTADYWWLVPATLSLAAAMWLKVIKWQMLLRPAGKASRTNLFYSMTIGYLVTDVLPGRLGELARVYSESRLDRLSLPAVLASVLVDRILDIVMLALLLAVTLPTVNLPEFVAQSGLVVGVGGLGLLAIAVLLAYPFGRRLFLRLLAASPRFPGKPLVEEWADSLCIGLQGLRGVGTQLSIILVTLAIWLLTGLMYYFGQFAFHIDAPFWAAIMILCLTNLGMIVPSSPGYIGVFHYLVVLGLGAYGVEREIALGFAIVMHLIGFLPVGILGAFSLWRCGMTLTDWRKAPEASQG